MAGLNGAQEVRVELCSETVVGYPDARGNRGQLVLAAATWNIGFDQLGPFSIDDIAVVELVSDADPTSAGLVPRIPTTLHKRHARRAGLSL